MIIAYLRVSTGRQHLENQEGEIKRYAELKGLEINRWVTETVSGKTESKDRLLGRTVRRLKKGDVLIVTELSRLSRSFLELMEIMKHCVDSAVVVHSTKEGYIFDDSINSKVLSFAFALSAELEHKLNSQRTREAMTFCRTQGKHMGRREGSSPKMHHLEACREEIIEKLTSGVSVKKICEEFGIAYETFRRFRKESIDDYFSPEPETCH